AERGRHRFRWWGRGAAQAAGNPFEQRRRAAKSSRDGVLTLAWRDLWWRRRLGMARSSRQRVRRYRATLEGRGQGLEEARGVLEPLLGRNGERKLDPRVHDLRQVAAQCTHAGARGGRDELHGFDQRRTFER